MKLGIHITEFETAGGTKGLRGALKDIAQYVDEAGFDSLSVMDHFFQIGLMGPAELNMLESYTTLAYFAATTQRIQLLAMVTGVVYRHPGILAKMVTTLDVLSDGRAMLGIGAAWNEREALGLGVPFPPLAERFERLEEALQIMLQMWSGEVKPYNGKYYQLAETLNRPDSVSAPHPPILIGGSGEKKTLRMVAQYADACNLFMTPDPTIIPRKLDILRQHCAALGRDMSTIEITATGRVRPEQSAQDVIEVCRAAHQQGVEHAMFIVPSIYDMRALEMLANEVIPVVREF